MRKPSHVTQDDLAKRLNVSKVTVSNALRGHPNIVLKTKARVKKLAEELDYTPNYFVRNFSSRQSNTIGVVLPTIAHFFSSLIETVYNAAFEYDDEVILTVSQENAEQGIKHLKTLMAVRVGGLLVLISQETKDTVFFDALKKKHTPPVFFDRVIDEIGFSSVTAADGNGALQAVEHPFENSRDVFE